MKRFLSLTLALLIAIVSAAAIVQTFSSAAFGASSTSWSFLPADWSAPSSATDSGYVKPAPPVIPPAYPSRLSIPALGINAAVQRLGVTAKGNIGSPSNFTDVGWYENGATPGMQGDAIINGHVDNGLALAGVFKHLSDIKVGDHVYVTTHGGTKLDFVVSSVDTYDYQHVPIDSILTSRGPATLSLITCDGAWVGDQKTYDERLVVTAALSVDE